jgi:signal transduction histidine kinase/CheY-like chemotaxis protein
MAKILIVDDRIDNRDFLVTLLGYKGHVILQASDGAEGLTVARAEHPDLVITDILMPTMDGYEFVRSLRSDPDTARSKVIFCTAHYLGREARKLAESCGVSQVLVKPCEPELVLSTVEKALGRTAAAIALPAHEDFDREHLRLLTDKLSDKAAELHVINRRLAELIQINLQLASENDTYRLLDRLCQSARHLISAKYAAVAVGISAKEKLDFFLTSGMDAAMTRSLGTPDLHAGALAAELMEGRAFRLNNLPGDPETVGFPAHHPPIHSFLSAPIATPDHLYGWLCLSNKVGAEEFSEEDESLTTMLAAQAGRSYEIRSLYADAKHLSGDLQTEVEEHRKAEQMVNLLNEELEQRVAERTQQLEDVNQELESFSYSVSHDLRAPLRIINGFSALLIESYSAQLPGEAQRYLRTISDNAGRMGTLIDDLLNLARLTHQPLHKELVDVNRLVGQVVEELKRDNGERKVEIPTAELPYCYADPSLLKQVIVNLLSNAFKFTRGRNPGVIEIGGTNSDNERSYFVRDNGVGFDMAYADKLFGVFERLHRAEDFEGTGVGLSLVQRIIHRHGGRVWAEAKPNEGATFYFTVPG